MYLTREHSFQSCSVEVTYPYGDFATVPVHRPRRVDPRSESESESESSDRNVLLEKHRFITPQKSHRSRTW